MSQTPPFRILFILYPQCTLLDFAGPLEVFGCLKDVEIRFASPAGGDIPVSPLLTVTGTERLADIDYCDLACVPGGMDDSGIDTPEMHLELRRIAESARYVTSVCTGSLVWAKAGVLTGRRSACHWAFLHNLARYGAIADPSRVVRDGRFISGGGVTAGLDFALTMVAELVGEANAKAVQLNIEYAPAPPYNAGHPSVAGADALIAFNTNYGEAFKKSGGRLPEL
jgi:cyclohexyl-isocyanide hydratase